MRPFKFNLFLIVVFGAGAVAAGYFSRSFLQQTAHDPVVQQARLMMSIVPSSVRQ